MLESPTYLQKREAVQTIGVLAGQSSTPRSRTITIVAVCFLLMWAAGTLSQAQTLTLNSSSVTGSCFAVDVTTSGFSSTQFEDLQFIVFVVDATTGESAHAISTESRIGQREPDHLPCRERNIRGCERHGLPFYIYYSRESEARIGTAQHHSK